MDNLPESLSAMLGGVDVCEVIDHALGAGDKWMLYELTLTVLEDRATRCKLEDSDLVLLDTRVQAVIKDVVEGRCTKTLPLTPVEWCQRDLIARWLDLSGPGFGELECLTKPQLVELSTLINNPDEVWMDCFEPSDRADIQSSIDEMAHPVLRHV